MVTVDEAIIARFDKDGKHFEILVDPDIAYGLKEGKIISLSNMLAVNTIFTDVKKGMRSSPSDLQVIFNTTDIEKISEIIVKKGDIQLTTEYRKKKTEEKKKQIANFISRYAINPQTRVPHPPDRIISSMDQAHVTVDPFKPAEHQVDDIVKALKPILPISMEEVILNIEISAKYAGRIYGIIKELGTMQKDTWLNDGSLAVRLLIPAGLKDNIYRRLGSLTEGTARIKEEVKK